MIDLSDFDPLSKMYMSIASDKLEIIRQQVQYHLDHEALRHMDPAREEALREQVKASLVRENPSD